MNRLKIDWLLFIPLFLLLILGLTILKSTAPDQVTQQAVIMLAALFISGLIAFTNYQSLSGFSWYLYLLAFLLLIATFIIGQTTRGAVRWIPLGPLKLQTSEIVKPLLIVFFARLASQRDLSELKNIFIAGILFLLPAVLIFRQPDLGSTLVVSALWLGIVFAAGLKLRYLLVGLLTLTLLLPFGWATLKGYQQTRLVTFINPLSDPLESGYNLLQSIIAVGSGQLLGRGLGQGTQSQLKFLPERHTDFIFASLAEELGFLGASLLIGLFAVLLWRILIAARRAPDKFGSFICIGVFSMLAFQIFINIGMNIGLVPITGITLPLISSGGSSLLSTLISLGLVASVSLRRRHIQAFEIH